MWRLQVHRTSVIMMITCSRISTQLAAPDHPIIVRTRALWAYKLQAFARLAKGLGVAMQAPSWRLLHSCCNARDPNAATHRMSRVCQHLCFTSCNTLIWQG